MSKKNSGSEPQPSRTLMEVDRRKSLGVVIRDLRKSMDLTQTELAKRIGKKLGTVSKIERGEHPLDVDTLSAVAKALRVTTFRLRVEALKVRGEVKPLHEDLLESFSDLLDVLDKKFPGL